MKIAVPTAQGMLCMHFGHCEHFYIADVNEQNEITGHETAVPPPHEPGVLPRWLADKGVGVIIAGGMGMRAQQLFTQFSIQVVVGAPAADPESVVTQWLAGTLETGTNVCDH